MGGFLTKAIDTGAEAISNASRREMAASMEHVATRTEAGTAYGNLLRDKIEPAMDASRMKLLEQYKQAPVGSKPFKLEQVDSMVRRGVKEQYFGKNNIGLMGILAAVEKQGGSIASEQLANAHNIYFKEPALEGSAWRSKAAIDPAKPNKGVVNISINTAYNPPRDFELKAKAFSRAVNLPFIAIGHAFQAPLYSLSVNGWTATAKAFAEVAHDGVSAKAMAMKNVAMSQETLYEMMASEKKGSFASKISMVTDPLRGVFNSERRFGVVVSAVAGKHAATESAVKFFASQGKNEAAGAQLRALGQDLNTVMKQGGKLTVDDLQRAAYRSADRVMGFRSPLETPLGWERNGATRLFTMYKPFGFRSIRLHQQVFREAFKQGGLARAAGLFATYTAVYPLAGEIMRGLQNVATGEFVDFNHGLTHPQFHNPAVPSEQQREHFFGHNRYVDDMGTACGLHLLYAVANAAGLNRLAEQTLGPIVGNIVSTAADVGKLAIAGRTARKSAAQNRITAAKQVGRDVLRQTGAAGRVVSPKLFPPKTIRRRSY